MLTVLSKKNTSAVIHSAGEAMRTAHGIDPNTCTREPFFSLEKRGTFFPGEKARRPEKSFFYLLRMWLSILTTHLKSHTISRSFILSKNNIYLVSIMCKELWRHSNKQNGYYFHIAYVLVG